LFLSDDGCVTLLHSLPVAESAAARTEDDVSCEAFEALVRIVPANAETMSPFFLVLTC